MYESIEFPILPDRPWFYVNFVATIDGKIGVPGRQKEYWPIGSAEDFAALLCLRMAADALVHGRNLAVEYGARTLERLAHPDFQGSRRLRGKHERLPYIILSRQRADAWAEDLRRGREDEVEFADGSRLKDLALSLKARGYHAVLVEGGARLAGAFFEAGLIDEIFLTVAPKVFCGDREHTLTMAEGPLLPPEMVARWRLVSAEAVGSEVFLRYRSSHT